MAVSVKKLAQYAAKRDFTKTAEPSGEGAAKASDKPVFVVQKHAARRLHYDFRLEWEGVLLSWAVTRGPSAVTSVKRLAVRTEDHPLDYGGFEGTIAPKQYGAGTVMLWDQGWWQPQEDFAEGLKTGKLKIILHGQRMKGRWALVRMQTKEKRENWLLIKEHDAFEEEDEDGLIERFDNSVKTGRSMDDIAAGKPAKKTAAKRPGKTAKPEASSKTGFTLATPKFRKPQLAKLTKHVPDGDDWLHETKFDGYRCLAALGKDGVTLYTRSGHDWTDRYAGLTEAFTELDCRNALIDGEVVAASSAGGSHFSALQRDLEERRPVIFMAFDLLELDGKSLVKLPLSERKQALNRLLAGQHRGAAVRYSEHVVGHGPQVFKAVEKAGGEGIISKSCDSSYTGTRSGSWLKIKTGLRQEFVVGGFSPSSARGRPFASLLVGSRENGVLRYRGRVGGGLGERDLETLTGLMQSRTRKTSPFDAVPAEIARSAKWVTPELVIEVDYAELTDQGSIRHGVFRGVRQDKEASMVKLETPDVPNSKDQKFLGIRVSSPDRVVFPDAGCTKGDVASYYAKAAERMLDLAGNRPVSLLRCPDGTEGDCFFQKHAGQGFPEGIGSVEITESSGKSQPYMVIEKPAGFVAAAQMGTIEFHIWGSRADALEKPDRLVFDLDPDEGLGFAEVKAAAKEVRKLLADIGLESIPMVTGGKGVHVIVPLKRIAEWDTVAFFARTIASHLAARFPDRYVATMSKAKRKGKIFIDWLRNDRGSTAVAPYSIRARNGAPVAVPVTWAELGRLKQANGFDIPKALKRLEQPCPLQGLEATQSISQAVVGALEKLINR
ncbi:MAG: DNA ligase D [Hoeflea sp.]|uniref:DNA ligase D n=1 Tax=Hoeflea sp. TaxID=1940281 RepID=UPI001D5821AA|nr:DNA ligase D [Hoeflea sp.]MBU4527930.1 DNA ligase D [Alphaproteobacteria bacterium]MBU4546035.1 DNA ligase D [Alphaproteobacteria bacterium]MBU4553280.1 DNA ligase D [Alphaproteobacteria bacterium]MBV1724354.1 DNA ligase D [Hoeflea sp.]MBV1763350.1 DNA ligase D [Hoeflea sp.]